MSEIPADHHHSAGRYEIRLKGHLDARWAALHGLIQKTRDLGLPLISVKHVDPHHPRPSAGDRNPAVSPKGN